MKMFMGKMFLILVLIIGLVQNSPLEPQTLEHHKILRYNGTLTEENLGIEFDHIGTLEIRLSQISGVTKDILSHFSNLENLTISFSRLQKSEDDVFSNCCPKLKNLKLESVENLNEKDLKEIATLRSLERLEIQDQDIPTLKSGILGGPSLKTLSLTQCEIEEIEDGAFQDLSKLDYLHISNNKLKTIRKEVLKPLKNLEILEFVSNKIEKFSTQNLPELPNLTDIVFIKEPLKELDLKGVHEVAPKLSDVFLVGIKGVYVLKTDSKLKVHKWSH